MEQLKILAYTDEKYTIQHLDKLTLKINPASIKLEKSIVYNEDRQLGTMNGSNSFERYKPEKLSFELFIDCTGTLEETENEKSAYLIVNDLENHLYCYNTEGHRPSYLLIVYGELLFKGQLTKMDIDYQMFSSTGVPLRAKINLAFGGFRGDEADKKKHGKLSPDMSRLITLTESDTLAVLCQKIYGDSTLMDQVARMNSLNSFRDIPAGTEILFPHLKKK